ncbi:MAG: hypothetical protein J5954_05800 [Prevotella sp.]|nr:hypothetical protein [Prevotella sp.]MBQ2675349.1 hypothetical protein [Prevotella sp.]
MKRIILTICIALATLSASAQTVSNNYGDLRAKVLHVEQKFTGQNTMNDQAIAVIVRELAHNYQGRLSNPQFEELRKTIERMRKQISKHTWQTILDEAIKILHEKTDTLDILQRILDYYKRVPKEQIYVHTDKPYYVPGDTVWFRAHLVDAVTHTPISRSRYVYVELLDNATDTLVQRVMVKCDSDGVFANAITLPRQLRSGCYTLAAYTQWMRNFPVERFFYKQLLVVGNTSLSGFQFEAVGLPVRSHQTPSPKPSDSELELGQRKGQLLIQMNKSISEPLSCVLYGSGNLIVTDYTLGKVLRIDSKTLRPGNLCIAIVNRETGDVITEKQTIIEGSQPQIAISGKARTQNEPMELSIDLAESDGTPLYGSFSLSVADYDVVIPDTIQPSIDKSLNQLSADYPLADILNGTYPRIDYGFQTTQTITGQIRGSIFKKIKNPKLMLVRPDTGFRQTFELGDSCHFTINGLDFADGTTYVLEGMRRTGSTSLVQLNIDPQTFPTLHSPFSSATSTLSVPDNFAKQAQEQVMYGSIDREIELPEVVKEKKRRHKPTNLLGVMPFRAFYDDDPLLNNFYSMEILLSTLGIPVYRDANGELQIRYRSGTVTRAMQGPVIFIDEFRSNVEELLMLQPQAIESIEWFDHVGAAHMTIYGWNVSTSGLLLVRQKPGLHGRIFRPLSMATVQPQGWKPSIEFYSPQYTDPTAKARPDHRTTLYWNPKVETDDNGHATVRFYASDVSKRYLVTLEGVSNDGIIVQKTVIIE